MNKFYIEGEEVESGTKLWADGDVQDGVEHGAPVHHGDGDGDGDGHGHGDCCFEQIVRSRMESSTVLLLTMFTLVLTHNIVLLKIEQTD